MTELTVDEVPAVVVVELECRLGPGGDLADANEYALGLTGFEMCRYVAERPVLVLRPPVLVVSDRLQQERDLGCRLLERGDQLGEPTGNLRGGHSSRRLIGSSGSALVAVPARRLIWHKRLGKEHDAAAGRSPGEHRDKRPVRKIVHLRARSLPGASSRSRIVRVKRRAPERPGPGADRDEDLTRRREGLAEVCNRCGEWPVDGIDVGRRPTHRLR